ncbi:MAG: DUF5997 family protein [Micropruina sp.]|uniref:DUF5997 family protein n=1 Tax=Micropruina sp. TaxID=2737536 RepID=UPI0039E48E3E
MSPTRCVSPMKPAAIAAELGIHLTAAPEEFRTAPIARAVLDALPTDRPAV